MTTSPHTITDRASSSKAAPHALLSGGGSGGHVFPGLAIAEELTRRGWQVSWAGSEQGLESRLVNERDIPFHALPARPLVGQGLAGKLRAAATLARSAWTARSLVRRLSARVVVGTGGYVSAPAVVGARLASRPAYLLEPNAEAGVANRLLSRVASEAGVAFDSTAAQLNCPSRTTGVPIRSAFFQGATPWQAGPPWHLLILGGSQGARQINEMVPRALASLPAGLGEIVVCHQAGKGHRQSTHDTYLEAGHQADREDTAAVADGPESAENGSESDSRIRFSVVSFLDDVAGAMRRSHLVISRAGAITLAEICASGRPSLLVPLSLAGGHQGGNARGLAEEGAARVLPSSASAADLGESLASLLGGAVGEGAAGGDDESDSCELAGMAAAAWRLGRRNAAATIADRVEILGGGAAREPLEEAN